MHTEGGTLIIAVIKFADIVLLVWPHEVESWLHSWYRSKVEILDAKYNLIFR